MTEEQLQPELDNLLDWLRLTLKEKGGMRHAAYEEACEHAEQLEPHAWGDTPEKLLRIQRPGEPQEVQDYRLSIYQPITYTEWQKALNVINRIFQPGQYAIIHTKEEIPGLPQRWSFEEYTEEYFGEYYSLMNFIKDVAIPNTMGDPNAVMAMLPVRNEPGEPKDVLPFVFECEHVLYRSRELVILKAEEKSRVYEGTTEVMKGATGWILTQFATFKFVQIGKLKDMNFDIALMDEHNLGEVPARVLGGQVRSENGAIWYASMLAGVVPHWNKALVISSEFDGFLNRHLIPHLVRAQNPCPTCHGSGKMLEGKEAVNCWTCGGSGQKFVNTKKTGSPYQDTTFDIKELRDMNASVGDLMAYVSPPTSNFREIREEIDNHINRGFASINMEVINQVGTNQSGVAKSIDRQDLNSFLADCATHFFDQIEWICWMIVDLRYRPFLGERADELMPIIRRPRKFDYVTVDGILQEAKTAKDAGLHPAIIRGLNISAAETIFGNKSPEAQMIRAQIELDPYEGISDDALLSLQAAGTLDPLDLYIHANIAKLLRMAMDADEDFLNLSMQEKEARIAEIAAAKMPKPAAAIPPTPNA